jgi:hypothetical protein
MSIIPLHAALNGGVCRDRDGLCRSGVARISGKRVVRFFGTHTVRSCPDVRAPSNESRRHRRRARTASSATALHPIALLASASRERRAPPSSVGQRSVRSGPDATAPSGERRRHRRRARTASSATALHPVALLASASHERRAPPSSVRQRSVPSGPDATAPSGERRRHRRRAPMLRHCRRASRLSCDGCKFRAWRPACDRS